MFCRSEIHTLANQCKPGYRTFRKIPWRHLVLIFLLIGVEIQADDLASLRRDFLEPPVDCRPHTRWWWMGNALRKQDISFQLSEMHKQGIGGVEQISMGPVFEKGNHAYLSQEFNDLLAYAVSEAKRYGMEFSLNFGGPGWIWGGDWVPKKDRNKNMVASSVDCIGPRLFRGELPLETVLNPRNPSEPLERIRPADQVLSVIAGQVEDRHILESSLIDLSALVQQRRVEWQVPPGHWRLMAFWLVGNETGGPVVDHFNPSAMQGYCNYLGGRLQAVIGTEFGKTIESVFADSFEVPVYRNGLYWSDRLLEEFQKTKGYDLRRYLPALWWEVGKISAKIRYDVNEFLHQVGIKSFFQTFLDWCRGNGVKARIQPYGFPTDILQGAGLAHIPEMEITAGEKDAVPWFDTRIGPRTYTASGAHLYGRNIVSAEAYTYLHWEQARDTLEELKIASDIFLRAGANQFYNHGYTATPETDFVPSRRFGAEMLISHPNTWWPYYRHLADYVARASVMLRQGRPVADVAVYSPLANQWTLDVLNARRWTRDFDWGELGRLLLANGYDFDLLNDDILQNHARLDGGCLRVRDLEYRILILPRIEALPLETMQRIEEYVRQGGVAIALERKPSASTGWKEYQQRDSQVRTICARLFADPKDADDVGERRYGSGFTYCMHRVMDRSNPLDRRSSPLDPFLKTLRRHLIPDMEIDLVREGWRENQGVVFCHRHRNDADIYFISNIQDRPIDMRIGFRVSGKAPQEWDPIHGRIRQLYEYECQSTRTLVPIRLAAYKSTFLLFTDPPDSSAILQSDFHRIVAVNPQGIETLAERNGNHWVARKTGWQRIPVEGLPAAYAISGNWKLVLEGKDFPRWEKSLTRLESWTEDPTTRHFSGTAQQSIDFDLPAAYIAGDLQLLLSLGAVGNVAEVELNGINLGVIWMRDQSLDGTSALRQGRNTLSIKVTNTLINRISGWKETPPPAADLVPLFGSGIRKDFSSKRNIFGFEPLPRSGLLGPVIITPLKRVHIALDSTKP